MNELIIFIGLTLKTIAWDTSETLHFHNDTVIPRELYTVTTYVVK